MPDPDLLTLCEGAQAWHLAAGPRLDRLDGAVRAGTTDPRLLAPWEHFARGLRAHFAEEELVLFPALRALAAGRAPTGEGWRQVVHQVERERSELETLATALRSAARDAGALEAELLALIDDLEEHARMEEEELLPAARAVLSGGPVGAPQGSEARAAPTEEARSPAGLLRRAARRLLGRA